MGRRARGDYADPGHPAGEDLLSDSPFSGDLDAELAASPQRRRPPGPTLYLGAGVLAVLGFLGGVQADKSWGGSKSGGTTALPSFGTRSGGLANFGGSGTRTGSGTGTGSGTVGTVEKIVGNTIYLRTAAGKTIKVTTGGATKVTVSTSGSAKQLKSGSTITVQGSAGSDGSVTATTITQGGGTP